MNKKGFSAILVLFFLLIVIIGLAVGIMLAGRSLSNEKIEEVTAIEDK